MKEPKIVAMYRVKNEERWIEKSLKTISEICDEIVILDDGSIDKTLQICKTFSKVIDIHSQSNLPFDETRDKNLLLKMALNRKPDYILTIDGDEVIAPQMKQILLEELNVLHPNAQVLEFQFLYIWDKPYQYRFDGIFGNTWHKRLFKIDNQAEDLIFDQTQYPGNAHCPGIPTNLKGIENSARSRIKILHYGYYDDILRKKKYQFYNQIDPNNVDFDGYRHIVSGNAKFSGHSGMELGILPKDLLAILKNNKISDDPEFLFDDVEPAHKLDFTGERLVPNLPELKFLYQEHISRYYFASQFVKSKIVLDVACGTGYGSTFLIDQKAKKVTGIDISKEAIEYCNTNYKRNGLEFKIDDCTRMHFENDSFDVVISFETIEHIEKASSFLSEVKRVLKKNGIFVVSTPNKMANLKDNHFHLHEYTQQEFNDILKNYFHYVTILNQYYPPVIGIYKGKIDEISEINSSETTLEANNDAQYFVAICSDKPFSYNNKLFLFNEKTILQFEYPILKLKMDELEREIKTKTLAIKNLRLKNNSLTESEKPPSHEYEKQLVELQDLLNESNIKLDRMYHSFTGNILRTRAEEILDKLYRQILGRSPDELAMRHYFPRLLNSEITEKDLEKFLKESDEYKALKRGSL